MIPSQAVVFFGTEQFSAPSLRALIDAGYNIAYVVTKPDTERGRGKNIESPEVKKIAIEHNIPVLQPMKISDIYDNLAHLDTPCGVLVAYGKIIPQSIINLFTPGILNVHPSLLPKYRGPSPIESALINGDSQTGISIMQLSASMDAGPVFRQITIPLVGNETKPGLYEKFAKQGADILIDCLPDILNGSLQPVPQQENTASYCSLLNKDDGIIDPEHKTAKQLEREIRAYLGFPKSRFKYHELPIIITSSHVTSSEQDEPLIIRCKDATFLSVDELIAPSGKKMNAEAFINGYR